MIIKRLELFHIEIPFLFSVDHQLKKRAVSDSIVIRLETDDSVLGYGEGAPRSYVNGETTSAIIEQFKEICQHFVGREVTNWNQITHLVDEVHFQANAPSLATALELALLDALGKSEKRSILDYFDPDDCFEPVYSAVLPFMPQEKLNKWLGVIHQMSLASVKVKVGEKNDEAVLQAVRETLGEKVDIRLDANQAWTFDEAVTSINQFAAYGVSSIEEPLKQAELQRLPELAGSVSVPIMLDETLCGMKDVKTFAETMPVDKVIFNLKLSKLGGLRQTSEIFTFAEQMGIACQLGCNVGETTVLSAAGRLFAQTHHIKHLEGSYAPLFMEDTLGEKPLTFEREGRAEKLSAPGLGIAVSEIKLNRYGTLQGAVS